MFSELAFLSYSFIWITEDQENNSSSGTLWRFGRIEQITISNQNSCNYRWTEADLRCLYGNPFQWDGTVSAQTRMVVRQQHTYRWRGRKEGKVAFCDIIKPNLLSLSSKGTAIVKMYLLTDFFQWVWLQFLIWHLFNYSYAWSCTCSQQQIWHVAVKFVFLSLE